MKKTFNRLLAATVAIPVALGQVLAISANAAEAPAALKVPDTVKLGSFFSTRTAGSGPVCGVTVRRLL